MSLSLTFILNGCHPPLVEQLAFFFIYNDDINLLLCFLFVLLKSLSGFVLLLNLYIPWFSHDFSMIKYGNSMTFQYPTLHTQWAHCMCIRILPEYHILCLTRMFIFVMVYFHFLWLLTFLKISMTSPGLEISHSNSMTFQVFHDGTKPVKYKTNKQTNKHLTSLSSIGALTICLSLNCTWAKCVVRAKSDEFSCSCSSSKCASWSAIWTWLKKQQRKKERNKLIRI